MSSVVDRFLKMPVYVHLLSVTAFFCIVVLVVFNRIDAYTNHNQAVVVPDVKGLQLEDAAPFFAKNMLRYSVIDSVYSKEAKPGAIVELTPAANSKVKKNRIVYVTVNAKTEETAPLPEITDVSYRQAYALLKSRGFAFLDIKYVKSEYRDLAIGVEYGGKMVKSGTRIPLTARLVLVIGDGNIADADSINEGKPQIIGGDESWF